MTKLPDVLDHRYIWPHFVDLHSASHPGVDLASVVVNSSVKESHLELLIALGQQVRFGIQIIKTYDVGSSREAVQWTLIPLNGVVVNLPFYNLPFFYFEMLRLKAVILDLYDGVDGVLRILRVLLLVVVESCHLVVGTREYRRHWNDSIFCLYYLALIAAIRLVLLTAVHSRMSPLLSLGSGSQETVSWLSLTVILHLV